MTTLPLCDCPRIAIGFVILYTILALYYPTIVRWLMYASTQISRALSRLHDR